jgi:hypothetical protein
MKYLLNSLRIAILLAITLFASCANSDSLILFDGKSLEGWDGPEGIFRVEDGCIVGGSMDKPLESSYYLCTVKKYDNFELTLKAKFKNKGTYENAGISFRAERVPNSTQVGGYQADMGYIEPDIIPKFSDFSPSDMNSPYPLWGILVDEYRSNTSRYPNADFAPVVFLDIPDRSLIENIIKKDNWSEIRIIANGPKIEIFINGVSTVNYLEKDEWVPREGRIGLQAHSGGPYEILYKDIRLRKL